MSEYGREILFEELKTMNGQRVLVIDDIPLFGEEPIPQQICTVHIDYDGYVEMSNDKYIFEYNLLGDCICGGFRAYEIIN